MDISDQLKSTLLKTYQLAFNLEKVSSLIYPRKIGEQGKKRLTTITREIRNFDQMVRSGAANMREKPKKTDLVKTGSKISSHDVVSDIPGYAIKKKLSRSIKEINERVKKSRAGKRSIGEYITDEAVSPQILKNLSTLHSSWNDRVKTPNSKNFEIREEKPQPYVPLTSAKIEDPVVLPSFEEFLEAKGAEFITKKGKEELFYRIEKAAERIGKLKEVLDQRLAHWNSGEDKRCKNKRATQTRHFHRTELTELKKNNELKKIISQYYSVPSAYAAPRARNSVSLSARPDSSVNVEQSLEESLRGFYRSKAIESRKLSDILEKIKLDRPYSIREKLSLIQADNERYKNKLHSIEKFNEFRETIELRKRERQYKSLAQAVFYFEILDEFKRKKIEPTEPELLLLEIWRRIIETGWVITRTDLEEIVSILSQEELDSKVVQSLIEKFSKNC